MSIGVLGFGQRLGLGCRVAGLLEVSPMEI